MSEDQSESEDSAQKQDTVNQQSNTETNSAHSVVQKRSGLSMKKLVGVLLAVVIILTGVVTWWIVDSDDDAETSNAPSSSEPVNTELSDQQTVNNEAAATFASDYLSNYTIMDEAYGTETTVAVDTAADTRTITTNALPNHDTGEFPNSDNPNAIFAQSSSYSFPLTPNFIGTATDARTPGVALNGVKFEPGTAETFSCTSGETYRVEAIQDLTSLGLDFNNAHVQPTGAYHYHGVSTMMAEIYDQGSDLVHVGFAADGHMIYYSKSGAYKSSYALGSGERSGSGCTFSISSRAAEVVFTNAKDGAITSDWEYVAGQGDLDQCNGMTIGDEYVYIMTNEFPYISRCLMGDAASEAPGGAGGGGTGGAPPSGGGPNGPPSGMPPQ